MPRLYFLQDVISHLLDVSDLSDHTSDVRRALRSAIWGFEQATTRHQWSIYNTQDVFTLNAPVERDDVTMLANGSFIATGDALPSWLEECSMVIGDEMYRVSMRTSDTIGVLENWRGDTFASGTSVKFVHNRKVLSYEPKQIYDVWNESEDCDLTLTSPEQYRDQDRYQVETGGVPQIATIRSVTQSGMLQYELQVAPFPDVATTLDIAYIRRPTQPRWNFKTGNVTSVSGTVTLTNAIPATQDMLGAWLRTARDSGGVGAEIQFGISEIDPAETEYKITAINSTTEIECEGMTDVTAKEGIITDVLDIPEFLYTTVLLYAEANMARIAHADMKKYQTCLQAADDHMRTAMEQGPIMNPRWVGSRRRVGLLQSMEALYIVES